MKNIDKELKELQLKYFSLKAAYDEDAIRQHQAKQKLVIANKELALLNSQIEKRSKEVLQEKENRFRAYVEQASDALFVHDFSGKFIDVNKRACETLGFSKEELLDMSVFDVEMDFDLEKAQEAWIQIKLDQHFMLLGHQRRKDGSIFPVEVSFGIFEMNDKRYFLKQARDITERKQAEEKLKENYALLNIAGDIAKLGGWNVNLEENRSYWSDEVAAIHEMPAGYAPLVEEGINFYAPEWRDKITEVFTNCVQKGISYDEDMEILTASGKRVWVRTIGEAVRNNKGKIVKVQGAFQDITERKQIVKELQQNEEKYRFMFDNNPQPMWIYDLETLAFLEINNAAISHYGYSREEFLSMTLKDIRPKEDLDDFFVNISQVGENLNFAGEWRHLKKNGEIITVEITSHFITFNNRKARHVMVNDITERKQAEDELKRSEEKFKNAVMNAPFPIMIHSEKGEVILINYIWQDITGYSHQEIPTIEKWTQLAYGEKMSIVKEEINYLFELGKRLDEGEYEITTKNGEKRIWAFSSAPIGQNSENQRLVMSMAMDITKRKIVEESLLKSKLEYQSFFEDDLTGDYISTVEGKLLNCNAAYLKILGFSSKEEALNYDMRKVYVNEENRNELIQKLKENKTLTTFEGDIKRVDGTIINVVANIIGGFDSKGDLKTFKGYLFDQTERKKALDQLRKLSVAVEQSPATVLMTDIKGNIEYVNKKFTKVTGYSRKDVIGKNPRIFNSGHQSKELYEQLWQNITSGKEWFGEMLNKKKDGSLYWEQASISPIKNNKGEITHFLGVKEDITQKKENEIKLIKALERAQESDRLKSAFIANMSHEIRTPMNGILGFTGLLKSADLNSDKQQKYLKIIEKSGARLLTTIDDIMNISKIESGLMKITLSEININDEIEELYAFFKLEADKKGLQLLVVNSLSEDQSIVKTDKEKLQYILVNLIKNAIKFTKQGHVEFGCSKKGNQLEFYVKDTGIGISKDRQPYIFDRFVQADIEDKAVFEGSGLGLAISKSYVEMLGGSIELESIEEIGSTFRFTISCQAINKEIPVAKNELLNDFVELEIPSLKILIVEDDIAAQLYLELLLSDVSKEILLADNGYKALDLVRENSDIDLILMDIRMPEINGYEVTKQIRQFNKEVIIIAQTAYALSGDREEALEAGCNDYISKPINRDHLVSLIQKYFKK